MDRFESLSNTLSNLTIYDLKSMYNQAKNVVLNISEMEAKVREATNDEPWGASSTLMQEIAQGTFNFQNFNEIMPCIYARFMEKEAKQWRQIYKALQLLEYLVKNGSERVVDDARSHIATIKMLRNFYYIDEKGKDQGLNVRNRSKELVELLSDVEKIRTERRKAKANKNKYTGVGNDALSFSSGGSRYGGFGSDSLGYGGGSSSGYGGDYSSRDYNDYSSSGGSGGFRDSSSRKTYEEYDAGDDDVVAARRSNSIRGSTSSPAPRRRGTGTPATPSTPTVPDKPKAPEPVPDLLGLDDDFSAPVAAPPAAASTSTKAPATTAQAPDLVDDDFDDFQAAPPSAGPATNNLAFLGSAPVVPAAAPPKATSPPLAQQTPLAPQPSANLFNMLSSTTTTSPPPLQANRPPSYMGAGMGSTIAPTVAPNYTSPVMTPNAPARQGSIGSVSNASATPAAKSAASSGFDDLWTMSLGSSAAKPQQSSTPAKSIQDLQKEKAQAAIWGSGQQQKPPMGAGFGSFSGASAGSSSNAAPPSSSGNGLDDLLF